MRLRKHDLGTYVCCVAVGLTVAGSARCANVGLWLFDEGTDIYAFDEGGNPDMDMTLRPDTNNAPTWVIDTPFSYPGNYALEFDGIDDLVRPGFAGSTNTWFQPDEDFTVEAWIKTSSSGGYRVVAGARIDQGYYLGLTSSDEAFFFMRDDSGDSAAVGPVVTDGQWHHLAGVYDAIAGMTLYVDGQPVGGDGPRTGTINYAGQYWVVGSLSLQAVYYFPGIIDEVRLVDRALTAEEVSYSSENSLGAEIETESYDVVDLPDVVIMGFEGRQGILYRLGSASQLAPPNWGLLPFTVVGSDKPLFMYDQAGSTTASYRIEVE
jgi:hypothetical protein